MFKLCRVEWWLGGGFGVLYVGVGWLFLDLLGNEDVDMFCGVCVG